MIDASQSNTAAARKALFDNEFLLNQLINSLRAPVYMTDAEGYLTMYNQAAADLWGRKPQLGKDLWCGSYKIRKPDGSDLPLEECPMAITLKEKKAVEGREIVVVRPDGTYQTVVPHPQPLFDEQGKLVGAVNMLLDVTEKNKQIRASEERYHKMIEEVEDYAIILLDVNGDIQNWNKGAQKIKGYTEDEILGKNFSIFYLEDDRGSGLPQQLMQLARKNGKALHEGWRVRKDGTRFWGSIVITALHDAEGNIIGFSKVTRDLTERKINEDRIKAYSSDLEFQNRELEQFAYAASHDLKEPIRKILFYNNYIQEKLRTDDEKINDFLNRSTNAALRMAKLVDDLLAYSHTYSDGNAFVEVSLNDTLAHVSGLYKEEVEDGSITFDIGNLPVVRAIPVQMEQLVSNIIGNSVKYRHPERPLRITVTCQDVPASAIGGYEGLFQEFHEISVSDNGVGFEQQYADKIFDIFQRLSQMPGKSGSGIGLAICKKIVQHHHGVVRAYGKPGEGATFKIYLPIA